ncbi:MAG: SDR family NAD(P)-dependent oxidoreductase [Actinobacteria bacterium]|nr:SDR family NAD(P)-dependent oxidoreductase [Actinomycetota bacterium]
MRDTRDPGQLVVISGAGSGIGLRTSLLLNQRGYHVLAGVRSSEQAQALRDRASQPDRMEPIRLDVTKAADTENAAGVVESHRTAGSRLVAVFSNAGIAGDIRDPSCEGTTDEELARVTEVDYLGAARFVRALLPALRGDRGRVVLNTAMMARIVIPYNGGYAAAKSALEAWGTSLRREVAQHGVKVIFVEFAGFATSMTESPGELSVNPVYPQEAVVAAQFGKLEAMAEKGNRSVDPQRAAETVLRAIAATHPRRRYIAGGGASLLATLGRLPLAWQDKLLARALRPSRG